MKLPDTKRRKVLVIIDVQEAFLRDHNRYIIEAIVGLIAAEPYDFYVDTVFDVDENSLWKQQQNWTIESKNIVTAAPIVKALKGRERLTLKKDTRSAFKGTVDLAALLHEKHIEEVHLVGLATHDCVLATAFESFDLGFPVYVLEECCESTTPGRHSEGVAMLRYQNMTNNSCLADTKEVTVSKSRFRSTPS